jgi:hypothetical protein
MTYILTRIMKIKCNKVTLSPPNSIGRMLESSKDPMDSKKQKGVYTILCSYGKAYIREACNLIQVRLKEHGIDIVYNRHKKYSLSKHAHNPNHHIRIEDTKMIAEEDYNIILIWLNVFNWIYQEI